MGNPQQPRATDRTLQDFLGHLARLVGERKAYLEDANGERWTIDNNDIYGGATFAAGGKNHAPDAGFMNAGRVKPGLLLYGLRYAAWFIEEALQRRWLVNGPKADKAMRAALEQLEGLHTYGSHGGIPVGPCSGPEKCRTLLVIAALKEALGDE